MKRTILTVKAQGDWSVGLSDHYWTIECPFFLADVGLEDLEFFRTKIKELYQEFDEQKIVTIYDFETED